MHVNLLSDSAFDEKGLKLVRENGVMRYSKDGMQVFQAKRSESMLWPIAAEVVTRELRSFAAMDQEDYATMMYRSMGHLGFDGLKRLGEGIVHGHVKSFKNIVSCEICSASNIKRRPFPPSKNPKSRHPMDLIHIDLIETKRKSRLAESYALILVDDHSKAKFAFPLKRKSDAVVELKHWMVYAE
jgi:hypothetical protein